MRKTLIALGVGLLLLLAGLPIAYQSWPARTPVAAAPAEGSPIADTFELRDATGQPVRQGSYRGRWMLVSFGFSHCPDACPTTLATVASALAALQEQAEQVQPVFVSLDPARDTPALLAEYTAFFDPRIQGLTGSEEQLARVAAAYGVYFRRVPSGDSYLIDHSTRVYLVDPQGVLRGLFSTGTRSEQMAREIAALLSAS